MMMGDDHSRTKNLKDLLDEDQEPFHLSQYIANKRSKFLPVVPRRQKKIKQIQKQRIYQNTSFPANLCKSACFFSTSFPAVDSPNRKSPLMLLSAHNKNNNNSNALFLNVPAKTAALLLESALRIQSQRSSVTSSFDRKNKSARFGLLGSVFRRITLRNWTRNPKIRSPSVDVVRWADSVKHDDEGSTTRQVLVQERPSSFWSEGNKSSVVLGSCFSSSSSTSNSSNIYSCSHSSRDDSDDDDDDQHQVTFVNGHLERRETCNDIGEFSFCQSPSSPFRFAIHTSPLPGRRAASGVPSPSSSPSTFEYQGNSNFEKDEEVNFQGEEAPKAAGRGVGREDKEQNSPVCVLNPPFEDDEVEVYPHGNNKNLEFNLHCSYEFVQKAKQSLLQKLSKFERLAELESAELYYEEELECSNSLSSSHVDIKDEDEDDIDSIIEKGFDMSTEEIQDLVIKVPGMKRLISDLIAEEHMMTINNNIRDDDSGPEVVVNRRAYKRIIESWEGRGSDTNIHDPVNTIAGMVELDFKGVKHGDEWKKAKQDISGQVREIEILIFSVLVEELFDR